MRIERMKSLGFAVCRRSGCPWEVTWRRDFEKLDAAREHMEKLAEGHMRGSGPAGHPPRAGCAGPVVVHVSQYVYVWP